MSLGPVERTAMIQCLGLELDPPKNAKAIKVGAERYEGTAMTNGWMAVYRQEGALFAEKTIVVFDLLSPGSALYSGWDFFQ